MINEELILEVYRASARDSINIDRLSKAELKKAFNKLLGNLWIVLNYEIAKENGMDLERHPV